VQYLLDRPETSGKYIAPSYRGYVARAGGDIKRRAVRGPRYRIGAPPLPAERMERIQAILGEPLPA
jgi:hypothetical protein